MNKIIKIIVAILGSCNLMMRVFIPIAISLLIINYYSLSNQTTIVLWFIAILSSLFEALKPTLQLQNG